MPENTVDDVWNAFKVDDVWNAFKVDLSRRDCPVGLTPKKFEGGELIYGPEDADQILYLISGYAKGIKYGGRVLIVDIFGPATIIGELRIPEAHEEIEYQTLIRGTYESASLTDFKIFLANNPEYVFPLLVNNLRNSNNFINKISHFDMEQTSKRISYILGELMDCFGEQTDRGTILPFPVTHEEIGQLIGRARENVTLELNRLTEYGIVDIKRRDIAVIDLEKLKSWPNLSKSKFKETYQS